MGNNSSSEGRAGVVGADPAASHRTPDHMPGQASDSFQAAHGTVRGDAEAIQILATEHWSLLATRSLTWNESFSRSGMFLTVLSAAVVALALIAQATGFGDEFQIFALVLLPVVLFIGLTTYFRLVAVNLDDLIWVVAMNRIRAGYLARRPDLAVHFTTGFHDDYDGVLRTYGSEGASFGPVAAVIGGFTTIPALIGTVTSVVGGILAGTLAARLGAGTGLFIGIGAATFGVILLLLLLYQAKAFFAFVRRGTSRFPSPPKQEPGS